MAKVLNESLAFVFDKDVTDEQVQLYRRFYENDGQKAEGYSPSAEDISKIRRAKLRERRVRFREALSLILPELKAWVARRPGTSTPHHAETNEPSPSLVTGDNENPSGEVVPPAVKAFLAQYFPGLVVAKRHGASTSQNPEAEKPTSSPATDSKTSSGGHVPLPTNPSGFDWNQKISRERQLRINRSVLQRQYFLTHAPPSQPNSVTASNQTHTSEASYRPSPGVPPALLPPVLYHTPSPRTPRSPSLPPLRISPPLSQAPLPYPHAGPSYPPLPPIADTPQFFNPDGPAPAMAPWNANHPCRFHPLAPQRRAPSPANLPSPGQYSSTGPGMTLPGIATLLNPPLPPWGLPAQRPQWTAHPGYAGPSTMFPPPEGYGNTTTNLGPRFSGDSAVLRRFSSDGPGGAMRLGYPGSVTRAAGSLNCTGAGGGTQEEETEDTEETERQRQRRAEVRAAMRISAIISPPDSDTTGGGSQSRGGSGGGSILPRGRKFNEISGGDELDDEWEDEE